MVKRVYKRKTPYKKPYKKYKSPLTLLPRMSTRAETKHADFIYTGQTINNVSGHVSCLTLVGSGSAQSQRQADQIKVVGVELQLELLTTVGTNVKIMLIYDKQTNGALPTIDAFLYAAAGNYQPYSGRNVANKNRFVCLKTWNKVIDLQYSGQTKRSIMNHYCKIPKGVATMYQTVNSNIAAILTGAIYLVAVSDDGTTNVSMYGLARLKYTDD